MPVSPLAGPAGPANFDRPAFRTATVLRLGAEHLSAGEPSSAIDFFRMAIQQARPGTEAMVSDALTGQAIALYHMGLEDEARNTMAELARRYPGSAMPLNKWGEILRAIDRPVEAKEKFSQAQARAPKNPLLLINVGALRRRESAAGRRPSLDAGLRGLAENCPLPEPTFTQLYHEGEALFLDRRYHEAASRFHQVLKRAPGHVPSMVQYARCLLELGQIQAALQVFELAKEHVQEEPELLLARSVARLAARDFEGCLQDCRQLITLTPDCHATYNNRGLAHMVMGKLPDAARDFEHAVRLAPEVALVWINLARALLALGRIDESRARLFQASNLDPKNPQLPMIYQQINRAIHADQAHQSLSRSSSFSHSSDSGQRDLPAHWVPV